MPSRHCLVPAQDDIHIERVKLDTAAASACLFGSDDRRSRTDEWVEDNIAPFGHVEQRIFQHANRLDGGVILKTLSSFGAHAGGTRIGPDVRAPATVLAELDIVDVGALPFLNNGGSST